MKSNNYQLGKRNDQNEQEPCKSDINNKYVARGSKSHYSADAVK